MQNFAFFAIRKFCTLLWIGQTCYVFPYMAEFVICGYRYHMLFSNAYPIGFKTHSDQKKARNENLSPVKKRDAPTESNRSERIFHRIFYSSGKYHSRRKNYLYLNQFNCIEYNISLLLKILRISTYLVW